MEANKKLNTYIICVVLLLFSSCNLNHKKNSGKLIHNPVLPGFYPDPSICRVNDDYYMVNSTFSWYPGVPIFHSRDLKNWKQIGHVLSRPEQLNLDSLNVSEGIFAPTLRYHKGVFYMITTLVGGGGNFIVTANSAKGPWSDPFWLPEINGIDPSIFFDNDSCYIVNNGPPSNNKSMYNGHRAIWIQRFDLNNMQLYGERKIIVNGGSDITKKPVWIEGPHIIKKEGWYYMIAAEGGTGEYHSEVAFRSKSVWGEWESCPVNPILTQRTLPANRPNPITSLGHADMVKTQTGEWWAVFLGCRPYLPHNENYYNTGRETFMAPVNWVNGWPLIAEKDKALKNTYPAPNLTPYKEKDYKELNGEFTIFDDFSHKELNRYWNFLRTPNNIWYEIANGSLNIQCRQETLYGKGNPSLIARRQQHAYCSATTVVKFTPENKHEIAGLTAFQNENHHYILGVSEILGKKTIQLLKANEKNQYDIIKNITSDNQLEKSDQIFLKIEAMGGSYNFYYTTDSANWKTVSANIDGTYLSTRVAGGFVGTYLGMFATSSNHESENTASFSYFKYEGNNPKQ